MWGHQSEFIWLYVTETQYKIPQEKEEFNGGIRNTLERSTVHICFLASFSQSFFSSDLVSKPVPCLRCSNLTIKNAPRNKWWAKQSNPLCSHLYKKAAHVCGVGGRISLCVDLFSPPAGYTVNRYYWLPPGRCYKGGILFLLSDLQRRVNDAPQALAGPSLACAGCLLFHGSPFSCISLSAIGSNPSIFDLYPFVYMCSWKTCKRFGARYFHWQKWHYGIDSFSSPPASTVFKIYPHCCVCGHCQSRVDYPGE